MHIASILISKILGDGTLTTIAEEEISDEEMNYVLAIMNNNSDNGQGTPRHLISRIINDFTGEKTKASILKSLREKGYIINNDHREIELTPETTAMIYKIAVNNWDRIPTRWRRVIYKNSQIKNISSVELVIIEKLLDSSEIIAKEIIRDYSCNTGGLLVLQKIGGLEFKNLRSENNASIIRGSNFPERVAEIIYYKETNREEPSADEWREKMEKVFHSVGFFKKDFDLEKKWRQKFNIAYEKAVKSGVCPIGLPVECKTAFKDDSDNLTATRHLSDKNLDMVIEIGVPSFRWREDDNRFYSTTEPIIEIRQTIGAFAANNIIIAGKRNTLFDILNVACEETEKIYYPIKIRKHKKPNSLDKIMADIKITGDRDWISIEIPTLVTTNQEKIGIVSYQKIKNILAKL